MVVGLFLLPTFLIVSVDWRSEISLGEVSPTLDRCVALGSLLLFLAVAFRSDDLCLLPLKVAFGGFQMRGCVRTELVRPMVLG